MPDLNTFDAVAFATERHGKQLYAGQPYAFHLGGVERVLADYGFNDRLWQARAWLHDVFEDTETTQHEVYELAGEQVADVCWAVTGEGVDRGQQQRSIREKIVRYRDYSPAILKAADRIDNLDNCLKDPATGEVNAKIGQMYLDERDFFCDYIRPRVPPRLMARLDLTYDRLAQALNATK